MIDYDDFDEVNEEIHINSSKKLRDALHDIIAEMDENEISYEDVCKKLKTEYSININIELFGKIMYDWEYRRVYTIFTEKDKKWLDPYNYLKIIRKKIKKVAVLGKGRKKIEKEEREARWKTTTRGTTTGRDGGGRYTNYPDPYGFYW